MLKDLKDTAASALYLPADLSKLVPALILWTLI
jgi:hypothetical protein